MIKVAISGAETPQAGELLRILVNHPDVEIVALLAPGFEGQQARFVHHGLLGEEPMAFTSVMPEKTDILFMADSAVSPAFLTRLHTKRPDLKIILLSGAGQGEEDGSEIVFGLPEINRKLLVRGASVAGVPSPMASLALVPLYPLALNMLLDGDISLKISVPADLDNADIIHRSTNEINAILGEVQKSFSGKVSLSVLPPLSKRGMELTAEMRCPIGMEHLMQLYEIYDDHHFAFVVNAPVRLDDVKGTEKCVVSVSMPEEGLLRIHAVADGRLRGSAGEAVHIMNLMCGLHEKTGLALKPYAY